jgi:hypothetical protein
VWEVKTRALALAQKYPFKQRFPMSDAPYLQAPTVTTKKAIYAEDILEAVLTFYQEQRTVAVTEKKLWPRSMLTPQMGAVGQDRSPKTVDIALLTAAPTNRISLREILEYAAHVMFKDYYSANVMPVAGRQVKYPEVFNILKKGTGLPVIKEAFGRKFDKVKAKLVSDLTKAGTVSSAYEYYNTFLLDASNFHVPVTTTPAAWADKVKEVSARFLVEVKKEAEPMPADPPALALALDDPKPMVAEPASTTVGTNDKDLEVYAKAGAAASQSSWFWRILGY